MSPATRLLTLALVATVALAACGSSGSSSSSSATTATAQSGVAATGCQKASKPKPKHAKLKAPPMTIKRGQKLSAVVTTTCGPFTIDLDTTQQPKTVNSFVHLARSGFYNGLDFHRVVPQFVVQAGDPLGTGMGGPGYTVTEKPPPNTVYNRGIVAMAKTGIQPPGASGSQFFVVTAPANAGLPPDYAVLGKVASGMSSVDKIAKLANPRLGPPGGEPIEPVLIKTIQVH